ncbi:MAG: hypothetical protein K6G85_06435 [Eubacterium sp.]|nr:hypothetical protein [Eubacterium sp.]
MTLDEYLNLEKRSSELFEQIVILSIEREEIQKQLDEHYDEMKEEYWKVTPHINLED